MTREKALSAYLAAKALVSLPGLSPAEIRIARQDLTRATIALHRAECKTELRAAYAGFSLHRRPQHAHP